MAINSIFTSSSFPSSGFISISIYFSAPINPMIYPPTMATKSPKTYVNGCDFPAKSENNIAIAISLFIGAEIRNENVTPIGILACINPKKSGIVHKYKMV